MKIINKNRFKISSLLVGTIVGAGLASGQEILQFFTLYGYISLLGILVCGSIYILLGVIIIKLSLKYNLSSYAGLIKLVSPGYLGIITDKLMGLFLISTVSIIMAGSGALLSEYLNISKLYGIIFMCIFSLLILFRNTKGLLEINSFIVPSLILVIGTIFILYIYNSNFDLNFAEHTFTYKKHWFLSSILYAGFNIFSSSGVLVPLCLEIKEERDLIIGIIGGSIVLTILCFCLNLILLSTMPSILNFEIPILHLLKNYGKLFNLIIIIVIWLEMFSTEVSNIFSLSKTLEESVNIPYKLCVVLILLIAIPFSQIGFVKLISILYPAFGFVSIVFIAKCIIFYYRNNIK